MLYNSECILTQDRVEVVFISYTHSYACMLNNVHLKGDLSSCDKLLLIDLLVKGDEETLCIVNETLGHMYS